MCSVKILHNLGSKCSVQMVLYVFKVELKIPNSSLIDQKLEIIYFSYAIWIQPFFLELAMRYKCLSREFVFLFREKS